jgi:hypothetical protein
MALYLGDFLPKPAPLSAATSQFHIPIFSKIFSFGVSYFIMFYHFPIYKMKNLDLIDSLHFCWST